MGIFDIFFKKKVEPIEPTEDETTISPETMECLEKFMQEMKLETQIPCVKLKRRRGELSIIDNKFGGKPYLPDGFNYPRDSEGKPLRLLVQLNFEKLPKLEGFPQKGLLQFFISPGGGYGMDFAGSLTNQDGFRVIYHADADASKSVDFEPPPLAKDAYFPFEGEFELIAQSVLCPVSAEDFRFGDMAQGLLYKTFGPEINGIFDLGDDASDLVCERFSGSGHKIGGYPFFTQSDPREYEEYGEHTILLLQIDSCGEGDDEIIWGDCGVANFFVRPQDLAALDFGNVVYHWDCY